MPQASRSLAVRRAPLAEPSMQRRLLQPPSLSVAFASVAQSHGLPPLRAEMVEILQVNLGKLCNMACRHCHVDAGPDRREIMTRETIDQCLDALGRSQIHTVDLTGGAPEMNPDFRYFVTAIRRMGKRVIDRCNLTILRAPGYADLVAFLAENQVEVVASLPCYLPGNTDRQRGDGTYALSIEALRMLNRSGYGQVDSGQNLTLVYNPVFDELPPDQSELEQSYRENLRRDHGIEFNRLFTITNMPISRFLEDLVDAGRHEDYMQLLVDSFNPAAYLGVMCRKMVSVSWDGRLFDCDFNQMLDIPVIGELPGTIDRWDETQFSGRDISVGQHCFGCTAGAGSGCQGALATGEN